MMRRLLLLVALGLRTVGAQSLTDSSAAVLRRLDSIPEFYKLASPASPAFILLGVSPTNIERPGTPRAVALWLVQNFAHGTQLALPVNAALDVAPYWLVGHPRLAWTDLQRPNSGLTWLRTLTLSLASAESSFKTADLLARDTSVSRVAFGLRSVIMQGRSAAASCVRQLEDGLLNLSTVRATTIAKYLDTHRGATAAQVESVSTTVTRDGRAVIDSLTKTCQKTLNVRYGFNLSVSGAVVGRFPAQSFDVGRVSSWGFWLTPMYAAERLTAVGVVRALKQDGGAPLSASMVDLGGRVIAAWDSYAVDLEQLWRHVDDSGVGDNRYRTAGGFHVKLTPSLWVNATLGRDFGAGDLHPLVALGGLQWNFGETSAQSPADFYRQVRSPGPAGSR